MHFGDRGLTILRRYLADWIMKVALTHSVKELQDARFFPKDDRDIGESFKHDSKENKDVLGLTDHSTKVKDECPPGVLIQTELLLLRDLKNLRRATHVIKARTIMTVMISLVA